jgi:hypothetical protein
VITVYISNIISVYYVITVPTKCPKNKKCEYTHTRARAHTHIYSEQSLQYLIVGSNIAILDNITTNSPIWRGKITSVALVAERHRNNETQNKRVAIQNKESINTNH